MAMDTMPSALDVAFRAALLLTGDTRTAEVAVMHGMAACEDLSPGGLLTAAVRSAVRRRTKSSDGPCKVECLSPEACAELLEVSVTEFEDAVYRALIQLPLLCSPRAHPT